MNMKDLTSLVGSLDINDKTSGLVPTTLLNKVDSLFACGVGDYVDLPQLVVVGDQSSGKSSVLVALSDLPFPRHDELCTRFATQIIFRRSDTPEIKVSIVPDKQSDPDHQARMSAWGQNHTEPLCSDSFAKLMIEAATAMGLSPVARTKHAQVFSRDVLVIEKAGPTEEHFSIIDVPGLFRATDEDSFNTGKEDIETVHEIVQGYMKNPRSVMLVVVPSNGDVATQAILQDARDIDPEGDRTIGILTKPDLVDQGGERKVMNLVEGKKQKLKLGWHLVRNPGQSQLDNPTQSPALIEERFFESQAPWNTLDKSLVGSKALKARLQTILSTHIRREFPKVKAELLRKLKEITDAHTALGPKLSNEQEQREFVMEIATAFQQIVTFATKAEYGRSAFFDDCNDDDLRLATALVNRSQKFATTMKILGHSIEFESSDDEDEEEEDLPSTSTRLIPDHDDLDDIVKEDDIVDEPDVQGIMDWIMDQYTRSRGFEIGSFNPALLGVMMKHQSSKWNAIANGYVSDAITLVHRFIMESLRFVVSKNSRLLEGISSLLLDSLTSKYEKALGHTDFLLRVELEGHLATLNDSLGSLFDENRQRGSTNTEDEKDCRARSVSGVVTEEIHAILCSYYEVARKRFVDNVRMQVADYYLVVAKDNPLGLFSPRFVAGMTADQLEEIAGEEPGVKEQRAKLSREMARLKKGRRILQ